MKSYKVVLAAILVTGMSIGAYAATSFGVAAINTCAWTDTSSPAINASLAAVTDVKIGDFLINNNSLTGFKLTFSSAKAGQMRGSLYDSTKTNTYMPYTIKVVAVSGTLGSTEPTAGTTTGLLPSGLSLASNHQATFGTTVTAATIDKLYDLKVTMSKNSSLFHDTYSDTITITIADI